VYPTLAPGKSVAPAYLLKLAEWTPSKNATVSFSVPKMYRDACTVNAEGRVVAKGEGLCGVRIKVVSPKGKIFYKRVYLTTG
jgi:sugar lactone lactonase YvrE